MKIKILVVVFGLVLFILGATAGFILSPSQRKNISPIIDERKIEDSVILENKEIKKIASLMKMGLMDEINVNISGEIISSDKDSFTLLRDENTIKIKVDEQTNIYRWTEFVEGETPKNREIELSDIRADETVGVFIMITKEGGLLARGISASEIEEEEETIST